MSLLDDDHAKDEQINLEWPAAVAKDPDYPELAPLKVDLASDAIVFKSDCWDDF